MTIDRRTFARLAMSFGVAAASRPAAAASQAVRLGQSTATLGYLPVWAARAFDTFAAQQVDLSWAVINGGDPASLAALDSGELDLAATGSDAVLDAVAKGQPFQIVYVLMSKMSLDLTVSEAFLKRTGVSVDQPLAERIRSLKGATLGVAVIGGAQDRTVRWLAGKGGLDPRKDVQIVQIGSAAALEAALENNRIDGFMLSAPEGQIAEAGKFGRILIAPDRDIPSIRGLPSLVLVARSDPNEAARQKIVASLRALNAGSRALLADLDAGADRIGAKFFPKLDPAVMRSSIHSLADGIGKQGAMSAEQAELLVKFAEEAGRTPPRGAAFWTNQFVELAQAPN